MSADPSLDQTVTLPPYTPVVEHDDELARLFVDRTMASGVRMLAMAEPVHRTSQGYLTAATALAAFDEALVVTASADIEAAMHRAFVAANAALRAANRAALVSQRAFAGITAVVIDGRTAIIGYVPPGQALLVQDGCLYGVPDLASWTPSYMPVLEADSHEPLGLLPVVRPTLRRTSIGQGDQVVLGTSAVGRVLAHNQRTPGANLHGAVVVEHLEEALEQSGIEEAYAAWMRVDTAPAHEPVSEERFAEIERTWLGEARPVATIEHPVDHQGDPRLWRADARGRFHDRLIEASERLLGGREPECLPLEARRRAATPPGAASLQRHVAPHGLSIGPSLRCRLPRAPIIRLSKRSLLGMFIVVMLIVSAALGYDVRQARADKQDRYLNAARIELELANASKSPEEAQEHLANARQSLDGAMRHGGDAEVVAEWRDQAARVEDRLNGINRLANITRIGALPETVEVGHPRLILAGDQLFLVAGSVYMVDEASLQLVPVLKPGQKIDQIKVGSLSNATVDGENLLVTDGKSLFRRHNAGDWSAERLAPSGVAGGWSAEACGAFQGSFYLLNASNAAQIAKFSAQRLDDAPEDWLAGDDADPLGDAVDMVVDGSIHVLTADGTIHTLHRGSERTTFSLGAKADGATFIGLDGGANGSFLYVLETGNNGARLIRYDRTAKVASQFLAPESNHAGFSAESSRAFSEARDFVVDEPNGIVYFVTADGLWSGSLG